MTPQESRLVAELFDRLAKLESVERDPEAERAIAAGLERAPHAVYALAQMTLLQDEALRRANSRLEQLQAEIGVAEPQARQPSFLDGMREALGVGRETRGSVPNVRPGASISSQQSAAAPPAGGPVNPAAVGHPGAPGFGGGSFLGTAASTAAGVIGGALLLDGIRSMFGHHGSLAPSSFGGLADGDRASPWGGNAADSSLARDLGVDHVGDHLHNAPDRTAAVASADADTRQPDDDLADDDFNSDDGGFADDGYDV